MLRFIHFSDIHFSSATAGFGFDPDRELRERVIQDVAEGRARLGKADAVLVSGDVAFSGKRAEYDVAAEWLDRVCVAAGCGTESVLMCPGNHDVDQGVIQANYLIQDGHEAVRRAEDAQRRERALTQRLVQPEARALFYSPTASYNEFAARYDCSFFADASSFVWERDFRLNDGGILRIRGMNSALLSGLSDAEGALYLGPRAWTLPRKSGVEYLAMSHHPPNWLADGREADRALEDAARIQLYGHEHDQRIQPGRDWVKLFAGAVNPSRNEPGWRPGYNVIEVRIDASGPRTMLVDVHAREWQGNPTQFRAIEDRDHDPVHRVSIRLRELPEAASAPADPRGLAEGAAPAFLGEEGPVNPQHRFRLAVYRFFRLSLSKKNEVVGHLRLAQDSDTRMTDVERFKLQLSRARERGVLDDLEALMTRLENGS